MGKRKNTTDVKRRDDIFPQSKNLKLETVIVGSLHNTSTSKSERRGDWQKWGPYLSERQWGTVREDISHDGNCWESFPHSEAHIRAYQYGEDGLFGFSDDQAQLCLALGLWNGNDPILKERLYGLTGPQGNHGEDVKECYYYLNSTPTHSYMKALYKYPISTFPYDDILNENTNRTVQDREYEIIDTGVFNQSNYFDVYAEYCKNSPYDVLCEYTVHNRSAEPADIHIIPQIWFRNTWSNAKTEKPKIQQLGASGVLCIHERLGKYIFEFENDKGSVEKLFTENETNMKLLGKETQKKIASSPKTSTQHGYKDAFHDYIVNGNIPALNSYSRGTKFGAHYQFSVAAKGSVTVRCRLVHEPQAKPLDFGQPFDKIINMARMEADNHYQQILPKNLSIHERQIAAQAYAGLCWNKQFFGYDLKRWIKAGKRNINQHWRHMVNNDVISMPDKWEFPWYATWDLAFHMIPFTDIDVEFVKDQLLLFLNQRYIHPTGQLPAYEFDFSDVNPPVHAMACLHAYRAGDQDIVFLKKCFNKLMLNFNWWMNNKQIGSSFLFGGGFLGMDNVSCLHRSQLPEGCILYQVDGSCWMAYFALCMMQISLELSIHDEAYIDMVVMYLDYFLSIAHAVNYGLDGTGLWDDEDGFFYDMLVTCKNSKSGKKQEVKQLMKVRAMIGLSTLFPVYTIEQDVFDKLPELHSKVVDLMSLRSETVDQIGLSWDKERSLYLSMLDKSRLLSVMKYLSDPDEFLSPHGIRGLSRYHLDEPFSVEIDGEIHSVHYNPGESHSDMFGGNSNWRGPIWFPMNYLLVESLEALDRHHRHSVRISYPSTSSHLMDLGDIAQDLCRRLVSIFLPDNKGVRPCHGGHPLYTNDEHFKDLVLFYEYFDGDSGRGCGASHQTGWTALVVTLLKKLKGL